MVMNALTEYEVTHVTVKTAILVKNAKFPLITAEIHRAEMEDRVRIEMIPTTVCVHRCIKETIVKFLLVSFYFIIL